jgi:hypothetical protein
MLGSDILQRYRSSFSRPESVLDLSGEMALDDYDAQQAVKMRDATLAKRKAAQTFQQERSKTAENKALFGPSYNPPDPDWTSEMAGLTKSPESKWWEANDRQLLATPTANATPGGAHLMGRGDTERTPLDSLAALSSNVTAQRGGGGMSAGGGGGKSGEVTYSPGGNYSRGPAMDDFDVERLKQERAKTSMLEQSVPQAATDRARTNAAFDMNAGIDRERVIHESEMAGLKSHLGAREAADTYFDPDVYRMAESKQRLATEAGEPGREIAGLKMQYDLAGKEAAANATMKSAETKAQAAQLIAVLSNIRQAAAAKSQGATFGAQADQLKSLDEAIEYLKSFGSPQVNLPGLIK